MLPAPSRLRASTDIQRVLRTGKRIHTDIATIYILSPSPVRHIRVACVAGKKVDARAVMRHRVQRKLRAAVSALPLKEDHTYDMLIVASNTKAGFMKNEDITNNLLHAITSTTLK